MRSRIKLLIIGGLAATVILIEAAAYSQTIIKTADVLIDAINMTVDGKKINTEAVMSGDTPYIPLSTLSQITDAYVEWNRFTKTAEISTKAEEIKQEISMEDAKEFSREQIAARLMERHLAYYRLVGEENQDKLEAYIITNVKLYESKSYGDVFTVKFAVKPVYGESGWYAGNGTIDSDGWIVNKLIFATVVCEDGVYRINGIGTAP